MTKSKPIIIGVTVDPEAERQVSAVRFSTTSRTIPS